MIQNFWYPLPSLVLHAACKKGRLNGRFLLIVTDVSVEIGNKLASFRRGTLIDKMQLSEWVETTI